MKFYEMFGLNKKEKITIEKFLNLEIVKNNDNDFKKLLNEYLIEFKPNYLKQQSWYNFFIEIIKEILLIIIFKNAIKHFPENEMNLTYLHEYYLSAIEIENKEELKDEINNLVKYNTLKNLQENKILEKLVEISTKI